ncbi:MULTISPECIES: hypothetical protein [Paenibacillus]|uniref:Adenylyltransferase n=1 Tax=Paenibacillus albilobatus TaxID=2716884 RepID=A0A919XCT2_9BACL|nr:MULTISPECIES: hypothetical protein [Paenibacillus]GIO30139.1 adenylyltransferase [Paenibacillus albilobatus]
MSLTKEIAKEILSYLPYRYVNLDKEFYVWLEKFEQMKEMTQEQIAEEQFKSFSAVVKMAYDESPFYRELYDKYGFHPRQLNDMSDIRRIPVIQKAMVKECGRDIIPHRHRSKRVFLSSTSGSTGASLTLYSNRKVEQREWAAVCFFWSQVGYTPGDGRIEFRGFFPGNEEYKVDRYQRVLRINVSKLTHQNIEKIIGLIEQTGYRYFHGYPSSLSLLSKLVLEKKLAHRLQPKALLIASETLHEYQMHSMKKAFPDAELYSFYGQSEKTVIAGWTNSTTSYSFNPLYGYVEFKPGTNAIIGTSFINDVMPLIRYELMDIASTPVISNPDAHYLFPTIHSIEGRVGEIMYKPNGDMVSSSLVAIALRGTKSVTACKLIQHQYDDIEILLETFQPMERIIEEFRPVIQKLYSIFTANMKFRMRVVDHIPREASGKFKSIEVMVKRDGIQI